MIVADLTELSISAVFDRGKANHERIVIAVHEAVNMGQFALLLGIKSEGNSAVPLRDNFCWFGDGLVSPDQLIFVYTGPGEPVKSTLPGSEIVTYSLHWGRETTVLHNPEVVPMLIRVDAVNVFQIGRPLLVQKNS
jgi:hypothetical protein